MINVTMHLLQCIYNASLFMMTRLDIVVKDLYSKWILAFGHHILIISLLLLPKIQLVVCFYAFNIP